MISASRTESGTHRQNRNHIIEEDTYEETGISDGGYDDV